MVEKPLISIIIPVYNVEDYLSSCLNSLVNQTSSDFELIIINDGSTDGSLTVINTYKSRFDRFLLINQENQGVSVARNNGILYASGEYIYFMDSDDYLEINFIQIVIENIKLADPDILIFGHNKVNKDGLIINTASVMSSINIDLEKNKDDLFFVLNRGLGLSVWDKVIKKSIIINNDISFKRMRNAEDFVFSIEIFSNCMNIKVINRILYNYRVQISGKRSDNYDLAKNHIIAMEKLLHFSKIGGAKLANATKFISRISVLWFGIVIPLNVSSFDKLDAVRKRELLRNIYEWDYYPKLCSKVYVNFLDTREKFIWFLVRIKSATILLFLGYLLSKLRRLKYI